VPTVVVASGPEPDFKELPHLPTFATVVEQGSFTAAAAALGITQAAVSQRIAALEQELRIALFDRRTARIALTEAGRLLHVHVRRILDLHRAARQELAGFHPAVRGELAIAASSVPGECFLPALLSAFHREHPGVHVRATVGDSSSVIREVLQGRATLGLVGQEPERRTLDAREIGSDSLVLVVPAGHRWAARKTIALHALAVEPLILREPGSGSRCALEKSLERAGRSLAELNIALELGSNAAIKDAVRRGLGVAFLSGLSVAAELATGVLHALAVRGLRTHRRFYLVHHRRRPLSRAASAFVQFLGSHPLGRESP
jgi:DNA-binding transcriptional LysR family regulator